MMLTNTRTAAAPIARARRGGVVSAMATGSFYAFAFTRG